jgi:aryl-alcohol dehydrogenase-like predicted oxidoreductase
MRMGVGAFPDSHWLEMFNLLADGGITAFHSSHEYESYPLFCRVLRQFRQDRPEAELQHIVKLACPGFNDTSFDRNRFRSAIDKELQSLGTERLDVVQWLIRQTPNSDELRIAALHECLPQFIDEWEDLRRSGKVGAIASFPYTVRFADEIIPLDLCDGIAAYLNAGELEYADRLDDLLNRGRGFLAIRPMFAGQMFESAGPDSSCASSAMEELGVSWDRLAEFCLSFPLLHPAVTTVIVSVSTLSHAEQNLKALTTAPNAGEFHRLAQCFAQKQATGQDRA